MIWPTGNSAKLRGAAAAWTSAGTNFQVSEILGAVGPMSSIGAQQIPEGPAIAAAFAETNRCAAGILRQCATVATHLTSYAAKIDTVHAAIIDLLSRICNPMTGIKEVWEFLTDEDEDEIKKIANDIRIIVDQFTAEVDALGQQIATALTEAQDDCFRHGPLCRKGVGPLLACHRRRPGSGPLRADMRRLPHGGGKRRREFVDIESAASRRRSKRLLALRVRRGRKGWSHSPAQTASRRPNSRGRNWARASSIGTNGPMTRSLQRARRCSTGRHLLLPGGALVETAQIRPPGGRRRRGTQGASRAEAGAVA